MFLAFIFCVAKQCAHGKCCQKNGSVDRVRIHAVRPFASRQPAAQIRLANNRKQDTNGFKIGVQVPRVVNGEMVVGCLTDLGLVGVETHVPIVKLVQSVACILHVTRMRLQPPTIMDQLSV